MIKIRQIKKQELSSLVSIWNENFNVLTSTKFKMTLDKAKLGFKSKLFSYIGLYEELVLIGFILFKQEKYIWIKHLAVRSTHRKKGYGKRLLNYVVKKSLKLNKLIKVEVLSSNKKALDFFLQNGFKILKFDKKNDQYILRIK